jgi:hypothetical protein
MTALPRQDDAPQQSGRSSGTKIISSKTTSGDRPVSPDSPMAHWHGRCRLPTWHTEVLLMRQRCHLRAIAWRS